MKLFVTDTNKKNLLDIQNTSPTPDTLALNRNPQGPNSSITHRLTRLQPYLIFLGFICSVLLVDAVLPLFNLWFHESLLVHLSHLTILPTLLLFPGWRVIPPVLHQRPGMPQNLLSWGTLALLLSAMGLLFLSYMSALRRLPGLISPRFLLLSTFFLGLIFTTFPIITSPDIFSYIAYARMGAIYGLNPLTTLPGAIHNDPIYSFLAWVDQPSAYGPTWTALTVAMQWVLARFGQGNNLLDMVLMLRGFGLITHLCSSWLIWSIGGALQQLHGIVSARKRMLATLAFAWNPLLLLEACTNAHNDTLLICLLLLAIWFLTRAQLTPVAPGFPRWLLPLRDWLSPGLRIQFTRLAPAAFLALGVCLKVNLILLAPGLFFYQWLLTADKPLKKRVRSLAISIGVFCGITVGLYAPFYNSGAIFTVFTVNPGTYRTINTLPDTLTHIYNGLMGALGMPIAPAIGSTAERVFHTASIAIFVLVYGFHCWIPLRTKHLSLTGLLRWMTISWLFYCALGSPWFWPWYMITFFGLCALLEASKPAQDYLVEDVQPQKDGPLYLARLFMQMQSHLLQPRVVRLCALSMLTLYCFLTWGPQHTYIPGLPGFPISALAGFWAWLLPLLPLLPLKYFKRRIPAPSSPVEELPSTVTLPHV